MQLAPEKNPDTNKDFTLQGGAFLITDERIVMNSRFLVSRNRRSIDLADVQSVDVQTYLATSNRFTVRTPAGPVVFDIPRNKKDAALVRDTILSGSANAKLKRSSGSVQHPLTVPSDNRGSSGHIAQLKELFELHQMGALTDDEFAAAKARVIHG